MKKTINPAVSAYFSKMGKKGGKKSAAVRIQKILKRAAHKKVGPSGGVIGDYDTTGGKK